MSHESKQAFTDLACFPPQKKDSVNFKLILVATIFFVQGYSEDNSWSFKSGVLKVRT